MCIIYSRCKMHAPKIVRSLPKISKITWYFWSFEMCVYHSTAHLTLAVRMTTSAGPEVFLLGACMMLEVTARAEKLSLWINHIDPKHTYIFTDKIMNICIHKINSKNALILLSHPAAEWEGKINLRCIVARELFSPLLTKPKESKVRVMNRLLGKPGGPIEIQHSAPSPCYAICWHF